MKSRENRINPEGTRSVDDPTRWCKQELDGVVGSVPPGKGCEVLDGELTLEEWDENDSENFADSNDAHILLKWGGVIIKCYEGRRISKSAISPLQLSTKRHSFHCFSKLPQQKYVWTEQ